MTDISHSILDDSIEYHSTLPESLDVTTTTTPKLDEDGNVKVTKDQPREFEGSTTTIIDGMIAKARIVENFDSYEDYIAYNLKVAEFKHIGVRLSTAPKRKCREAEYQPITALQLMRVRQKLELERVLTSDVDTLTTDERGFRFRQRQEQNGDRWTVTEAEYTKHKFKHSILRKLIKG